MMQVLRYQTVSYFMAYRPQIKGPEPRPESPTAVTIERPPQNAS